MVSMDRADCKRWARVLPKKDDKFDDVIAHLRTTPLASLSGKYSDLRTRIVDHQFNVFIEAANSTCRAYPGQPKSSSNTPHLSIEPRCGEQDVDGHFFDNAMWC